MAKIGRPTKRTPELEERIFNGLKVGLSFESVAGLVGIHSETLRDWRRADECFSGACKEAIEGGKNYVAAQLVNQINKGHVGAMIFWLARRTEEFKEPPRIKASPIAAEALAAELMAAAQEMRKTIPTNRIEKVNGTNGVNGKNGHNGSN